METVRIADTDAEREACVPVLRELRERLTEEEILDRVTHQYEDGYRLAYVESGGHVRAVAGFRILRNLAWGRFLYVDDLVTLPSDRSKGLGRVLMEWLVERARTQGCDELHLDSGVHRAAAHRFYLERGLEISSYHFGMAL